MSITVKAQPDGTGEARPVTEPFDVQALVGDSGFLWAINRLVFHPRGFALSVEMSTGQLQLWGDGSETWQFEEGDDDQYRRNFEATLSRLQEEWAAQP